MRLPITVLVFLLPGFSLLPVQAKELTSEQVEFFEKKIRPVLAENCYECHNSIDKKKGDLALDWRAPLVESGVIVPGKPEESALIKAIRHEEDYEPMPSKSPKLAKLIIKNFEDWIRMGAPDPRGSKPTKEELALAKRYAWDREPRTISARALLEVRARRAADASARITREAP